jgi:hypothetical protein
MATHIPTDARIGKITFTDQGYYRLTIVHHGQVTDIIEFGGTAIANGFDPFAGRQINRLEFDQWPVSYGRAEKQLTKMKKIILCRN